MNELVFEIFQSGTWTSSNGKTLEFTEEHLDSIASQYNPEVEEAPITLGHPWLGTEPAYGWIKEVFRVGNKLYARAVDLCDEFIDLLKQKKYKKRSIGLSKDLQLKHVAFLGAANPAVKGLADITFSEEPDNFEFDDFIDINGYEPDNAPDESSDDAPSDDNNSAPDAPQPDENKPMFSDQQLDKILTSVKDFISEFQKAKDNSANSVPEAEQNLNYKLISDFLNYCDEKIQNGKSYLFIKNEFSVILNYLASLRLLNSEQFADLISLFKNTFNSFPANLDFEIPAPVTTNPKYDDFENQKVDQDSLKIHKQIINLMNSENLSYKEAFEKLIKE